MALSTESRQHPSLRPSSRQSETPPSLHTHSMDIISTLHPVTLWLQRLGNPAKNLYTVHIAFNKEPHCVAFLFHQPTYAVQKSLDTQANALQRAACLLYMGAGPNLIYKSFLPLQCYNPQLTTLICDLPPSKQAISTVSYRCSRKSVTSVFVLRSELSRDSSFKCFWALLWLTAASVAWSQANVRWSKDMHAPSLFYHHCQR